MDYYIKFSTRKHYHIPYKNGSKCAILCLFGDPEGKQASNGAGVAELAPPRRGEVESDFHALGIYNQEWENW